MFVSFDTRWLYGLNKQEEIDTRLFDLLERIHTGISLREAATSSGLSYRYSWGLIKHWESVFSTPLVLMERGRGKIASLTEFGVKLLWARREVHNRTAGELNDFATKLNESLAKYAHPDKNTRIGLFASHGMEITYLNELLMKDGVLDIDFQIHGSIESLQNLNRGLCQIAGFHLPLQHITEIVASEYRHWLVPNKHRLVKVATRNQGIITQRGNPKKIQGLKDLGRRSIRFINRQRNSGTRAILDQLLIQEGVNPSTINGYANEEFTHLAVAAMISSGAVDAGFGIQAAADQFDLDYVHYLSELYILAIENSLGPDIQIEIINKLRSHTFRRKINSLAGYSAKESGKELSFNEVLGNN